jgi:membrane associated rhomboid family serine protease
MSIPSKVMAPKTEDLISGDQDLGFLEGEVKKIMDRTLKMYVRNMSNFGIAYLVVGVVGVIWALLSYAIFSYHLTPNSGISPMVILGIGLFFIVYSMIFFKISDINFKYIALKNIRNIRDWKKFLDNKESAAKSADPRGRLEMLMRMVASMGEWLHTEKTVEEQTISILGSPLIFVGIIVFIIQAPFSINSPLIPLTFITSIFGFSIFVLTGIYYIERKYKKILNYWVPRLMTYRARLDSYWRML